MCDSVQRTRILFPHSSFQLPSTRQDSPQTRCKPYKEFRQHVGYTDSDRRKQKINKQRNSCGCRRSGNMTGQKCRTFVYKPYNGKMDRIQEHTLAHPGADFWKADSAGKRPACHRDSHPVKAGPETGKKKRKLVDYQYDLGDCMFCELCVNACNFGAIKFVNDFENAVFLRFRILFRS